MLKGSVGLRMVGVIVGVVKTAVNSLDDNRYKSEVKFYFEIMNNFLGSLCCQLNIDTSFTKHLTTNRWKSLNFF